MGAIDMRPEDLPGVLADMAEIAGVEATLAYAADFGGACVYIPSAFDPEHDECRLLARAFGEKAARAIVARIGRGRVEIPNARRQIVAWAVARGGRNKEIARRFKITERTIRRERTRQRAMRAQLSLFRSGMEAEPC